MNFFQMADKNDLLEPDKHFYPVKKIEGSYLKRDPSSNKSKSTCGYYVSIFLDFNDLFSIFLFLRSVKRVSWIDTDIWMDTVDASHLPFRGYV